MIETQKIVSTIDVVVLRSLIKGLAIEINTIDAALRNEKRMNKHKKSIMRTARNELRKRARAAYIVYGMIRNVPYRSIENRSINVLNKISVIELIKYINSTQLNTNEIIYAINDYITDVPYLMH